LSKKSLSKKSLSKRSKSDSNQTSNQTNTNSSPTVIIYSTPTCGYCQLAKELFNEHNISYTEHDVAADATKRQEMIQKTGQLGVPVIEIDDKILVGYNEATIADLLGIQI